MRLYGREKAVQQEGGPWAFGSLHITYLCLQGLLLKGEQLFGEVDRGLNPNPKGLHCDSPIGIFQRLQTTYFSAIATLGTVGSLNRMAQVKEQLAQQPCPIAEPSLVLVSTQNEQLFQLLSKWFGYHTQKRNKYIASKIQRGLLGIVPLHWLWEGPDTTTCPSPQKSFPDMLYTSKSLEISLK